MLNELSHSQKAASGMSPFIGISRTESSQGVSGCQCWGEAHGAAEMDTGFQS
jgi:hypothetical protein